MGGLPPPPPPGRSYGTRGSPHAGPYSDVVRSRGPVQPLRGLALATSILLAVMAVLSLFGAGAFANRAGVVNDFLDGGEQSLGALDDIDDADGMVAAASALYSLGLLATAIPFVTWQFRHGRNAEAIAGGTGLGSEWAIAGWFIPCANHVLPGVQLFQSSRASDVQLDPRAPVRAGQGSLLVIAWAAALGLGGLLFTVSRIWFPDEEDLARDLNRADDAIDADNLAAGSLLVLLVAAVLGIVMVRSLTRRQEARAAVLASRDALGYGAHGSPYGHPGPPGRAGGPVGPGPGGAPGGAGQLTPAWGQPHPDSGASPPPHAPPPQAPTQQEPPARGSAWPPPPGSPP